MILVKKRQTEGGRLLQEEEDLYEELTVYEHFKKNLKESGSFQL